MGPVNAMSLPFAGWLTGQRWYAGRTRQLVGALPAAVTALRDDLDLVQLEARFVDGPAERYQVPVLWSAEAIADIDDSAMIGVAHGRIGYDALHHPESASYLMRLCADSARRDDVVFTAEPGAELPTRATPRVSSAEQSNTSVVFDDRAILKVFRRLTRGINPDIELNRVLGRAGNRNVARLLASFDTTWDGQPCPLGMVTEFAAGSDEGWALATAAAADAAEFTEPSRRLGAAVAAVHATLAAELGTTTATFDVDTAVNRLRAATAQVSELARYAPAIEHSFAALAEHPITVQRIHGDLHLGQVLYDKQRWLVIDFEGEPGTPAAERRRPDSALRDVAGMLRSYEYAAFQPIVGRDEAQTYNEEAALAWAQRHRSAFCAGYAAESGQDPRDAAAVLRAYELDKAGYEVAYEARYRPQWLPIPLRAIDRLLSQTPESS